MPSRNSKKTYVENGYYHIYNRGVEKRKIFLDRKDYLVFLSYLKEYLLAKDNEIIKKFSDPNISYRDKARISKILRMNNFSQEITLLAYCLMPNHFHLFVKQKSKDAIDSFMNSIGTRYTMYFNKRHKRVGPLYQGAYKAVQLSNENQFLYLSRYIHKQALVLEDQPNSYPEFLEMRQTLWVKPNEILAYFSKINPSLSYQNFVEQPEDLNNLRDITLE